MNLPPDQLLVEVSLRLRDGSVFPLLVALEHAAAGNADARDRAALDELAAEIRASLGLPQPDSPVPPKPETSAAPVPRAGIAPSALYTAREAAELLGLQRVKSVYEVPERHLPSTRVGPRRGRKMFRGSDLLAYMDRGRRSPG
jgi:hypothetical protein